MSSNRRFGRIGVIAACAVCAAAALSWFKSGEPSSPPAADWRGAERAAFEPFAEVDPLAPLTCRLTLQSKSWVYAVSHDTTRGCLALWPSSQLRSSITTGAWPAGEYELPGQHLDNQLLWHAGDALGPLTFTLIVSDQRLPTLEAAMERMQQVGNGAFPQRPMLGTYAPRDGMSVVPRPSEIPHELLRSAFASQRYAHDGVMHPLEPGIYASTLRLRVRRGSAAEQPMLDRVRDELGRELGPLLDPQPAPVTPR